MSGRRVCLCLLAALVVASCTRDSFNLVSDKSLVPEGGVTDSGRPPVVDANTMDASNPSPMRDAAPVADAAQFTPVARCGEDPCACDDGLDNDGDGFIDGFDPECTGALDEDEATFATGKMPKTKACRDCYWDEDQGTGNDSCRYPSDCLRGAALSGNGNCKSCAVADVCVETCAARAPSGCDCFGCCEVWRPNGVKVSVELRESCSLGKLDDVAACPRCTQSSQCRNICGRCELCPGRTRRDLPADCGNSGPEARCEEGQAVCSTSADCTTDQYCQQGCCFLLLL